MSVDHGGKAKNQLFLFFCQCFTPWQKVAGRFDGGKAKRIFTRDDITR